jgi:hypothetical protein
MSPWNRLRAHVSPRVPTTWKRSAVRYWKRLRKLSCVARPSSRQTDRDSARVQPPVVESVKAWCQGQPDIDCQLVRPAERTTRQAPRTIEPVVDERFSRMTQYTIPEKYVVRIPRARLIGETGLVVLPDGSFTSEVTFGTHHLVQQRAYFTPLPRKVLRKRGNFFSLLLLWANGDNYYHWVHDAILRLHLILPYLPRDIRFIVPPNLRSFQKDTLALLGVSTDQLCAFSGQDFWELEALYFAPPTAAPAANSPAALRWLREIAWAKYGVTPAPGKRRIYISRRQTRYRRLVNEAEVERVLGDFGFETFIFEDLSFREQVELMGQAEAIVSTSGAGLVNLLFAPPGAKVFVMFGPAQKSWIWWSMCEAVGHVFWLAGGEAVPGLPPQDADLLVPAHKVVRTLETMFGA